MPKMQVNDDGTIAFPVKERGVLQLDEPGLLQLAQMHDKVHAVDEQMPELPPIPNITRGVEPTEEQRAMLDKYAEVQQQRTIAIYGEKLPYAHLVLELVNATAIDRGDEITLEQLYGWAANPKVLSTMLEQWRSPLPGLASRLNATT